MNDRHHPYKGGREKEPDILCSVLIAIHLLFERVSVFLPRILRGEIFTKVVFG